MSITRPEGGWKKTVPMTSPGKMLLHEFIEPLGLSTEAFAAKAGIPPTRLQEIIDGDRALTREDAEQLGAAVDMSPNFWLNLAAGKMNP